MRRISEGIFEERKARYVTLLTKNLTPGKKFFTEEVTEIDKKEYRIWDLRKSKFAAAIAKGLQSPLRENSKILYLGAAHGYTASFFSDIASKGYIVALDFAPRVVRKLIFLAEDRKNVAPLLADANHPENYSKFVPEINVLYQDIAQKNQVEIFRKNAGIFLRSGDIAMLALKARSIDVTQQPKKIFQEVKLDLKSDFKIVDYRNLEPFQHDHAFFLCRKR